MREEKTTEQKSRNKDKKQSQYGFLFWGFSRWPAGRVTHAMEYSSCLSVISVFVFGITEP